MALSWFQLLHLFPKQSFLSGGKWKGNETKCGHMEHVGSKGKAISDGMKRPLSHQKRVFCLDVCRKMGTTR